MKICVVGSLNYDLVTGVSTVPNGGETVRAHSFNTFYGGKGANQAYALRRLIHPESADISMVGCVGSATFGQDLLDHLAMSGVDVSNVVSVEKERTGTATILVESSGENRIMVYPGANAYVLDIADKITDDIDFVVLQNEIPLETTFAVLRKASGLKITKTVFNPSPLPEITIQEWPHVDVLCVNEREAEALAAMPVNTKDSAVAALSVLRKYCTTCVITLGSRGVVWHHADEEPGFEPAQMVEKVVDTTGAGDTFLAAFLSQMINPELSMQQRIAFAAKAAAVAVSRPGAATSIPSIDELVPKKN